MGRFFKIFTYSEIFLTYNFNQSVLIVLFFLFSYHLQLLILTISQLAIFHPCVLGVKNDDGCMTKNSENKGIKTTKEDPKDLTLQ